MNEPLGVPLPKRDANLDVQAADPIVDRDSPPVTDAAMFITCMSRRTETIETKKNGPI